MKYKRLAPEELKELQKEFVNFLSAAQITGPDWVKMKETEIDKANELIDVFSDLVYEKVLKKIRYLEFREKKNLTIFHCGEDKIDLIGLAVKGKGKLDLTDPQILQQWNESNNDSVKVIRTEKKYQKERELEVLEMLESGCLITDDRLFKLISSFT